MENRKRLVQTLVSLLAESYEAGEATQQRVMKRRLSERFNELPKDDIRFYPLCRMMLSHLMDKELALSIIDERKERNDDSSIELCILSYRALGRLNDMWTSICSHLDIKAAVDIGADELAYQGDVGSLVTFLYKVRNTDFSGARSYASQDILSSISTRLLNIFSSCSMEDEYTGELEYNILHFFQPDFEKIHLFRKRVNEGRWKEVYAKLKKSALLCYRMPVLMLEENDMDTLMDWGGRMRNTSRLNMRESSMRFIQRGLYILR